jgi:MazG family protein
MRREAVLSELGRLYDLTRRLRRECPWDRKQTQEDIVAYTLEETYELVDTVRNRAQRGDAAVCGELGDLLFQVYFLASVAEDEGLYDLGDVASGIHEKLVRRHPHIFGEVSAETPDEVRKTWDAIKRESEGREGIFHDVPEAFPSTLLAQKLQQRAAAVGFDWEDAADVLAKVKEETAEIEYELQAGGWSRAGRDRGPRNPGGQSVDHQTVPRGPAEHSPGPDDREAATDDRETSSEDRGKVAAEVGDLLLTVVNLSRKLKVDPELALREAALRFRGRVEAAAGAADADGLVFEELDLEEQEEYYQRAKKEQRR